MWLVWLERAGGVRCGGAVTTSLWQRGGQDDLVVATTSLGGSLAAGQVVVKWQKRQAGAAMRPAGLATQGTTPAPEEGAVQARRIHDVGTQ